MRVAPTAVGADEVPTAYLVNLPDGGPALDMFEGSLAGLAPAAGADNTYQDLVDQANSLLGYLELLKAGIAAGLFGLLIGMLVPGARIASERRAISVTLAQMGAGPGDRAVAHWLSQTGLLVIGAAAVTAICEVFWVCMNAIDPRMYVEPATGLRILGLVLAAGVVLGTVTYPRLRDGPRPASDPDHSRSVDVVGAS